MGQDVLVVLLGYIQLCQGESYTSQLIYHIFVKINIKTNNLVL